VILRSTDIRGALQSRARAQGRQRLGVKQRGFLLNPFRFGVGGDPNFAQRSLLLHMEGGSFVDSSSYAHAVTASGATQDTGWAYFGTKSALIASSGGNQNRLTVPHHASFNVGANEFGIEFALRLTTVQTSIIVNKAVGTGFFPYQVWINGDKLGFRCFDAGNNLGGIESTTTLAANTDYWVQCRRLNGVVAGTSAAHFQLAINGVQEATNPLFSIGTSLADNTELLVIGNFNSGATFPTIGRIDELRITNGALIAFGVPGSAFPDS
jgi:hypothetical protein